MSQPNPTAEKLENDWKNHEIAGLIYAGKDEEGDNEWVGTRAQWEKYDQLTNQDYD